MEDKLKDILSNFDCGPLSEEEAVEAIFSLFEFSERQCMSCEKSMKKWEAIILCKECTE